MEPITRLKELRELCDLTQNELAVKADVSLGTVQRIENAVEHDELRGVGLGRLIALAATVNVRPVEVYPRLNQRTSKYD